MGRLLVATDGSEHSRKALDKALGMAGENDEIVVLYVIPAGGIKELEALNPEGQKAEAREIVNRAVDVAKARNRKVIAVVREGNVADEIINFARELECSLILIGSKGMSKVGSFALGHVAESVARNADRAVLILR